VTFQPAVLPEDRPATAQVTAQVAAQVGKGIDINKLEHLIGECTSLTAQVTAQVVAQVIVFCQTPRRAPEIMDMLEVKRRRTFRENYLKPLLEAELIERTIPDKPTSSKQGYRVGPKGKEMLKGFIRKEP
jgi:ATP-dependent DNA helicase RecG